MKACLLLLVCLYLALQMNLSGALRATRDTNSRQNKPLERPNRASPGNNEDDFWGTRGRRADPQLFYTLPDEDPLMTPSSEYEIGVSIVQLLRKLREDKDRLADAIASFKRNRYPRIPEPSLLKNSGKEFRQDFTQRLTDKRNNNDDTTESTDFWAYRGKRRNLKTGNKDDDFWPNRGK